MLTAPTPTTSATVPTGVTPAQPQPQTPTINQNQPQAQPAPAQAPTQAPTQAPEHSPLPEEPATTDSIAIGLLWYAVGALSYAIMHDKTVEAIKTDKSANGLFMLDVILDNSKIIPIDKTSMAGGEKAAKEEEAVNREAFEEAVAMSAADAVRNGEAASEADYRTQVIQAVQAPFEETEEEVPEVPAESQPEQPTAPVTPPVVEPEPEPVVEPTEVVNENPIKAFNDLPFIILKGGGRIPVGLLITELLKTKGGEKNLVWSLKNKPASLQNVVLSAVSNPKTRNVLEKALNSSNKVSERDSKMSQKAVMKL
ncbi:MAG: hypothetical protein JHC33_04285, partial [Ignisphaera sp.]|nr:hypothetical protein [Ignisphaera sp.]